MIIYFKGQEIDTNIVEPKYLYYKHKQTANRVINWWYIRYNIKEDCYEVVSKDNIQIVGDQEGVRDRINAKEYIPMTEEYAKCLTDLNELEQINYPKFI